MAKLIENEEAVKAAEKMQAALEADPEVSVLMKAAETVEDVYEIIKRFSKATLAQVKVLFDKTVDYFKESKAELSDETLDNVVGGWSLSSWWNKNKAAIVGWTVFGVCCAVGVIAGAATFGLGGAAVGLVMGGVVGGLGGAALGISINEWEKEKQQ